MSGASLLLMAATQASFTVTASPPALNSGSIYVGATPAPPEDISTSATTAIPAGGSGSYSYAWTFVSGTRTVTADSPTSATTAFTIAGVQAPETVSATVRCTVTDTITAATAPVDVNITHEALVK